MSGPTWTRTTGPDTVVWACTRSGSELARVTSVHFPDRHTVHVARIAPAADLRPPARPRLTEYQGGDQGVVVRWVQSTLRQRGWRAAAGTKRSPFVRPQT